MHSGGGEGTGGLYLWAPIIWKTDGAAAVDFLHLPFKLLGCSVALEEEEEERAKNSLMRVATAARSSTGTNRNPR